MIIEEAKNGKEALQKIEDHTPDFIFMDIRLPRASGVTLTKKIKTAHPNIIIAVLTSYDLPEYRNAALQSGANHFFSKSSSNRKHIIKLVESNFIDINH
jgi:YesN/AraC family two-component response regulator